MKLHRFAIIGLFFIIISSFLLSCHRERGRSYLLFRADSIMNNDPDSALSILESIPNPTTLHGSERADYALFLTRARKKMGISATNDSLIKIAVDYYSKGWNDERKMQAYFYRASVYRDLRYMDLAVKDYLKALKVIPKKSEYLYLGAIYENLAGCYEEQNLFDEANNSFRKACEIYVAQNKEDGLFYATRGIGYIFMLNNKLDSALVYYQKALNIAESIKDNQYKSVVFSDIGILYSEKGEYQKANQYVSKSINILPDKDDLYAEYLRKGRIFRKLQELDSAKYYINISKNSPYIYNKAGSYNELYHIEKEDSNYEMAMLAVDSFMLYLDSIHTTTKASETAQLINRYEAKLYQQKLAGRYKIEVLSLVLLFIVGGTTYLWIDKRRKKKYLQLQKELMKSRTNVLSKDPDEEEGEEPDFCDILKPKIVLCLQLFYTTDTYKALRSVEKGMGTINLSINEGQDICNCLYETFGDVMLSMRIKYTELTKEDLLYSVFMLLGYSKQSILSCTRASEGAFKSRKSRIKEKTGDKFFEWLTNYYQPKL